MGRGLVQAGAEVVDLALQVLVGGVVFCTEERAGSEQHGDRRRGDAGVSQGVPTEDNGLPVAAVTSDMAVHFFDGHRGGEYVVVGAVRDRTDPLPDPVPPPTSHAFGLID